MRILTIGHSSLPVEVFVERLRCYEVEVVVDVRSAPYSSRFPQYRRAALRLTLEDVKIEYAFAGRELGGKPRDAALLRPDGGPDYDRMAAAPAYRDGLQWLVALAREKRVAVMCAEAVPEVCHRHKLIGRSLCALGVDVRHILPDGSLGPPAQPWLLAAEEEGPWRNL